MDRYRYGGRPRSPVYNPARTSLPINLAYPENQQVHVIPARRDVTPSPRSSSTISNAGTVTTTYKVKADPVRGSSVRGGSRTRRTTLDNTLRPNLPTIVTAAPRHRPTVVQHSARPASPMKNPYRSSEEEYVAIPASRHNGHKKRYSLTMDNGDMSRYGREGERLRPGSGREGAVYTGTRSRTPFSAAVVRHPDTVADDYGDDGYGYTNPRDLVQYDLNRTVPPTHHRSRRDSFDASRARPSSIGTYAEVAPRSYDARERGPPPTTRGFDRIPYEQAPQVRMPVPPPPSSMAPIDPVQRPSAFEPIEPVRRSNSRSNTRPTSMYHDRERRGPREDYYEVRDEDLRRRERPERAERTQRHENYDPAVEQRGFGIRSDAEPVSRHERSDRLDRQDRPSKPETEHKNRDAIATGLSLAGAALGINAVKNASQDHRDSKEEREERRRREYDEDSRRRRERDAVDVKERRHREDDVVPPPIPPKIIPSPPRDETEVVKDQSSPELLDSKDRAPRERPSSRADRETDLERRDRQRRRAEAALSGVAIASQSDASLSDEGAPRSKRELRRRESGVAHGFNPKDTTDLMALKDALNSQEAPKAADPKETQTRTRTPRQSMTRESREVAEIRGELVRRSHDPQPRLVSPPRDKPEDKPVKGILRQPRERFPEDPAPIREGVAPLKDAKKDGIPPDARWTKISRKLVNPEALELGKERFEAREDFVIVLRVLSRDEVQGYAEVTQKLRAAREEREDVDALERRRARRERHERHKRERAGEVSRGDRPSGRSHHHHSASTPVNSSSHGGGDRERERERDRREAQRSNSESETTDDEDGRDLSDGDRVRDAPMMIEPAKKRATFENAIMSGGLGADLGGGLRETSVKGQYEGYTRNPGLMMSSGR